MCFCYLFQRFSHLLTHYPGLVIFAVGIISAFLYYPLTYRKLPSFEDPQLGFETRGTDISNRLITWDLLILESKPSGLLVANPKDFFDRLAYEKRWLNNSTQETVESKEQKKDKLRKKLAKDRKAKKIRNKWEELQQIKFPDRDNSPNKKEKKKFYCETDDYGYAHLVVSSRNNANLFTYEALKEICQNQLKIEDLKSYTSSCVTTKKRYCCNPWSLPNYIAFIHNYTSCDHIKEEDVNNTIQLLTLCSKYYSEHKLEPDVLNTDGIPKVCIINREGIYKMMHFILDVNFSPKEDGTAHLKDTVILLPVVKSTSTLTLFHEIENETFSETMTQITAMDLGSKYPLFDEYLVRDIRLLVYSTIFIVMFMWFYTGCLFVTSLTISAIFLSLVVAYYIYTIILGLTFFPFMNMLAVIVTLGIGSDDTYIMCKVWDRTKKEFPQSDKTEIAKLVIKHSSVAVFVSTLTTVAAFLSSYVSSVTSVRCFSVFAGLAVLVNFVFMMTWVLAGIIKAADWPYIPFIHWSFSRDTEVIYENIILVKSSFENVIATIITKYHAVLAAILGTISFISMCLVLFWPRLQVPDSAEFQLFHKDHVFEQYDLVYKHRFWFNQVLMGEGAVEKLPLRFVWGVLPLDNGNYLDPSSRGKLHFDPTFDISAMESQEWLLRFCRRLRMQPFYQSTSGPMLSNCFIETFKLWMEQKCTNFFGEKMFPCCEETTFPYSRRIFNLCIVKAMSSLHETPRTFFMSEVAGPLFNKDEHHMTIQAVIVEFDSNMSYTTSFDAMNSFHQQVEAWSKKEFHSAPLGMRNGFYVSHLAFYDLQRTLTEDTNESIIVSMLVAFVVLMLATLNVPLSLYAILTITCIIFVAVAVLVLLGWKLNVLESVAIAVAIGLSVDFSLHYAVNYKLCPDKRCRKTAVIHALSTMSGPSLMAALTTGASGLFMLPSTVLPYIQIGLFLIVVSSVSWIYATFFLMSILFMVGPENNFGQYTYPNFELSYIFTIFKKCPGIKIVSDFFQSKSEHVYSIHEMESLNNEARSVPVIVPKPSSSRRIMSMINFGTPQPSVSHEVPNSTIAFLPRNSFNSNTYVET